jgi:hypothetical protein
LPLAQRGIDRGPLAVNLVNYDEDVILDVEGNAPVLAAVGRLKSWAVWHDEHAHLLGIGEGIVLQDADAVV